MGGIDPKQKKQMKAQLKRMEKKGQTNTILASKTAKLWKDKYLSVPEDPEMTCKKCGGKGATSAPLVTWRQNMYWQVGSDPVGQIRGEPEMQSILCIDCRIIMIDVLEEEGDFFDP